MIFNGQIISFDNIYIYYYYYYLLLLLYNQKYPKFWFTSTCRVSNVAMRHPRSNLIKWKFLVGKIIAQGRFSMAMFDCQNSAYKIGDIFEPMNRFGLKQKR